MITVSEVRVRKGDQPVWVYYHGCNNRPWKPSKGMLRVLAAAWSRDSSLWVGKSIELYGDKSVRWAGKEIGGIRIKALSDIKPSGISCMLTVSRGKRQEYRVGFLSLEMPAYPEDKFRENFALMVSWINEEGKSIEQVVSQMQKTGKPTAAQLKALEESVIVVADDE